jgi:hypothetical protein
LLHRGACWEAWRAGPRAPAERRLDATKFDANGYPDLQAGFVVFDSYPNILWDLGRDRQEGSILVTAAPRLVPRQTLAVTRIDTSTRL